jgi:hypothetical protein
VWILQVSFAHANPLVLNAGDQVRGFILLLLPLCPCGAAWSWDARGNTTPRWVHPWPIRLLFVQMVLMYTFAGVYKLAGDHWPAGHALYLVLSDPTVCRWPYGALPVPYLLTRLLTWTILIWEVGFPLWIYLRTTRATALWLGVVLHLGIGLFLDLGLFALYMVCLYLPLWRWEELGDRVRTRLAGARAAS